jgi:hypothetical protein
METVEILTKCGHCQNVANCKVKGSYKYEDEDEVSHYIITYHFLQCPACSNPILIQSTVATSSFEDPTNSFEDPIELENHWQRTLYPTEKSMSHENMIPFNVKRAYEAALKVQKVEPNGFAVLVGRTLEVICKHEKASGKVLADKIKWLADSGRIPNILADMARQLKELRNLGAHADEYDEVTEQDATIIREFVDAILEYLYIAPAKVAELQARLDGKFEIDDHPF